MLSLLEIPNANAASDMAAFGKIVNPIIQNIVYPILGLMFGLAVLIFVYGALQFVLHGADEEARDKGKKTLLWGTFGMFIMVSAWGIIYLVSDTVKSF